MNQPNTKSSLTPGQTRLVELMQSLNFGRIEALQIRDGQPIFDPPPRVVQKVKIGADNNSRVEVEYADFRLKLGVIELLDAIGKLREGEVRAIEIRFGLPVSAEIEWCADWSQLSLPLITRRDGDGQ